MEPAVDHEADRSHRAKESGMREEAVLPEELAVPDVLDLRERDPLLVDGSRDQIALPAAVPQEQVPGDRARREILVDGALVAVQLLPQDFGGQRGGAGERAGRLAEARHGREQQPLALERLEPQLGKNFVDDRGGGQVDDGELPHGQDRLE